MTISKTRTDIDYRTALEPFWDDARPLNHVNGAWQDTAQRRASQDPSTGADYTTIPESSREEVGLAVEAAVLAQPAWAALTVAERAKHLKDFRAALEEHGEALALLESIDSGNPLPSTRRDLGLALKYLEEWPGQALAQGGQVHRPYRDGISIVTHEPYGVVGKIIAYNHPTLFAIAGLIYPLLAGNTIVIKAAAQTPVATLALGALINAAFPAGVVNIISGGTEAGDAIVTHPQIKRVAFTGSDSTALAIQSRLSASGIVKHFSAELGGKNAFIVCEDADVEAAANAAFAGLSLTVSSGQSCQATARILVHTSISAAFEDRLTRLLEDLAVGPAYDTETHMGPLVSETQLRKVDELVRSGIAEGARLVTGGHRLDRDGYFYAPTLFADTQAQMRISREEIFGPVALIQTFDDEQHAIDLANGVDLGLSAAIWTNDLDRALRMSSAIQAGYIWINDANRHYSGAPFGGMKGSGVGREESVDEYFSYTETKAVNIKVRPA